MEAKRLRIFPPDQPLPAPEVSEALEAAVLPPGGGSPPQAAKTRDGVTPAAATRPGLGGVLAGMRASNHSVRRRLCLAAGIMPVFAGLYWLAYWLRFDGALDPHSLASFQTTLWLVVLIKTLTFAWFRVYQGWTRYVTFHDLVTLAKAATVSSLLLSLVDYLFLRSLLPPRSVFLMDWGLTLVVLSGLRALGRFVQEQAPSVFQSGTATPAFIVGANDSGETLLRAIRRSPKLPYRIVGFLAEDAAAVGTRIAGVPVIGTLEQTCPLAKKHGVGEVLITAGDLPGRRVRELVNAGLEAGVTVKALPSYEQLIHGNVDLRPRQISIEDLLRREPVKLDARGLHQWLGERVLLVTGSAGSIGSEICRQLLQFSPARLVLVDRSETGQFFLERELRRLSSSVQVDVCLADLLDQRRMTQVLRQYRPDVIFHAAAYKHVPLMESHPGEAVKNIILATRQLADLAALYCRDAFVMISTDKAVNPTSVMGACKRAAELYVQSLGAQATCRFVTVRFGNVLDSAGSVVPIFRQQIAEGGPVTVTHPEMRRFFMTIPEAARLVIQAGALGQGGHILLLDMGEPVRIVDLAEDMIRLSGLRVGDDVAIEFTGMRPGEKLYEELHWEGERQLPTSHPKIIVVDHQSADGDQIAAAVQELELLADEAPAQIPARLARLVPEYGPPVRQLPAVRRAA